MNPFGRHLNAEIHAMVVRGDFMRKVSFLGFR